MNASRVEKPRIAARAKVVSAWLVYALAAAAHVTDVSSTAAGLASGRAELNPIARAFSEFVPPLASVIALKAIAVGLLVTLLCKWSSREDADELWIPIMVVGLISFVATSAVVWSNYQ